MHESWFKHYSSKLQILNTWNVKYVQGCCYSRRWTLSCWDSAQMRQQATLSQFLNYCLQARNLPSCRRHKPAITDPNWVCYLTSKLPCRLIEHYDAWRDKQDLIYSTAEAANSVCRPTTVWSSAVMAGDCTLPDMTPPDVFCSVTVTLNREVPGSLHFDVSKSNLQEVHHTHVKCPFPYTGKIILPHCTYPVKSADATSYCLLYAVSGSLQCQKTAQLSHRSHQVPGLSRLKLSE